MRKATHTTLAATVDGSAFIVEPLDQSLMHTPSEHAVKKKAQLLARERNLTTYETSFVNIEASQAHSEIFRWKSEVDATKNGDQAS